MGIIKKGTINTAGRIGAKGFFHYLKWGGIVLIFGIVLLSAVFDSIQQRSFEPLLREIGGNVFLSTLKLATESQKVIEEGNLYSFQEGFFRGVWQVIVTYAKFGTALYTVILWIRLFSFIYARGPFGSFPGNTFINVLFGIIIYYIFQVAILLILSGVNHSITSFSDGASLFLVPFKAFFLFFKALAIVFSPIENQVTNSSTDVISNLSVNLSNLY